MPEHIQSHLKGRKGEHPREGSSSSIYITPTPPLSCFRMESIPYGRSLLLTLTSSGGEVIGSVHPAAYRVKMMGRSVSLMNVTNSLSARVAELRKESDKLDIVIGKNQPMHKTGKIWRQRLKSTGRELTRIQDGMTIVQDLIVLEAVYNGTILLARSLLERIPPQPTSHSTTDSIRNDENERQRKYWTIKLKEAKMMNHKVTCKIHNKLVGGPEIIKELVRNEYYTCSECQTLYWKHYKDAFGLLDYADRADKTSPFRFLCSCCSRLHMEKPNLVSENKVHQGESLCVPVKVSPPRSVRRKVSLSKDRPVNKPPSDEKKQPLKERPVENVNVPVETPATVGSVVTASNDDWVDYLLRTGSIIALSKYMDEQLGEN